MLVGSVAEACELRRSGILVGSVGMRRYKLRRSGKTDRAAPTEPGSFRSPIFVA
jgi:hypothetical protein